MPGCVGLGMSCIERLKIVSESSGPCDNPLGKPFLVYDVQLWTV